MKRILCIVLGLLLLVIIAVAVIFVLPSNTTGPVGDLAGQAKTAATNVALDATGVKDKVKSALESSRNQIAAATGLSVTEVDSAISKLNIDNWKAVTLPADAKETGTISGSALGLPGDITTYEDPTYLSLAAYGQTVTLAVPPDVQMYLTYLG